MRRLTPIELAETPIHGSSDYQAEQTDAATRQDGTGPPTVLEVLGSGFQATSNSSALRSSLTRYTGTTRGGLVTATATADLVFFPLRRLRRRSGHPTVKLPACKA